MPDITITALGIAGVKISGKTKKIYVDAIIDTRKHPNINADISDADIILVTHDHADHFDAEGAAAAAKKTNAVIVGPPSIAYPMLARCKVSPDKLAILYHQDPGVAAETKVDDVCIRSYASPHFHDGDNMTIHNSYLIEMDGKKIYVTGDSHNITKKDERVYSPDAMIVNTVFFDKKAEHLSIFETLNNEYHPRYIVAVHLIDCDWTVPIDDVKKEIKRMGMGNAAVPDREMPEISV